MRHRLKGRKLNRKSSHRRSMFANMSASLLKNGFIRTTLPKAKELRPIIEKYITLSKVDNVHNRRLAGEFFYEKDAVSVLFNKVGKDCYNRNGGYTRVIKDGFRYGDNAPMAVIEIIDCVL